MIILGIETAVMNWGSAALLDKGKIIEEQYERGNDYRDRLWPAIDRVLKGAGIHLEQIEGIAVSQGPGSFTGLRVGISVAKTLALSLKKPLFGVSTLEILARGLDSCFTESPNLLIPILDAKKNLVYAAIFRRNLVRNPRHRRGSRPAPKGMVAPRRLISNGVKRETDDLVLTIEEICRMIKEPAIFLGEGLKVYKSIIKKRLGDLAHFAPEEFFFPRASIVAQLGEEKLRLKKEDNLYELQPIYLRVPEISSKK